MSTFVDAIREAGLTPPEHIEPGRIHRFPGRGKLNGNKSARCKLFADGQGGWWQDYSSGAKGTWQAGREHTDTEKREFNQRVAAERERQEAQEAEEKDRQKENALKRWQQASTVSAHSYLKAKGVKAHGLRTSGRNLLIPLRDITGTFQGLQWIGEKGHKGFTEGTTLQGSCFPIGKPDGRMYICEGYATGASIQEVTGHAVAVAFNAGNLKAVAGGLRDKYPSISITIAADNDQWTEGNPGVSFAKEAAEAVGGQVVIPRFKDTTNHPTDFNDLRQLEGAQEVKEQINNVAPIHGGKAYEWPEPMDLITKTAALKYPLDALPNGIREAVEEVQQFVKAPVPLVASSSLAAISLATQAHVDVRRADKLSGPTGLFMLIIGESGERKSTCDGFFTEAIKNYEDEQEELAKPLLSDHRAELGAWEAKRKGVKEKIQQLAKTGSDAGPQERVLTDLEHNKPEAPRVPKMIYEDATPEALKWGLAKQWPSAGVMSSEAGLVLGSHGMGKDTVMRSLATFNKLWDGAATQTDRRTTECFTVRGARLTVALQIQESALGSFLDQSGALARGTGFMARFLMAWPETTQGTRFFSEPPEHWPALDRFHHRMTEILRNRAPIDENGALNPVMLDLSPEAKAMWIEFHDDIESEIGQGKSLCEVRDVASKIADNAARLAALLHVFENGLGPVSAEAFEAASRVVLWHLNESRRFFGELALPEEMSNAVKLDEWLLEYCRTHGINAVSTREAKQFAPNALRKKEVLDSAIKELIDFGRLRIAKIEGRKSLEVNPKLLHLAAQK